MNEEVRHFSLRKLSVGLASVLVGVSIFGASQTVKADTVADQTASAVTNNTQSSDTQKNKNVAESTFSNDNQPANAKSNATQTQENKPKQDQTKSIQQDSAPKTQEVNNSNDLGAKKDIVSTSSLQESNNQSNTVTKKTVQHNALESGQKTQSFNLPKNSQTFAKKVLATNLIETTSSSMTNGGFDEATWGKLDVNDWQGSAQDGVYQLTGYTGDENHVIVPNEADFEKAGKSTNGLQVGITCDTLSSIFSRNNHVQTTVAFSKTNNKKVKAIGTDWSKAFSEDHVSLSKFDGSNLDVSNVTNMSYMFSYNHIRDLTSLANWDVSNVTNMDHMFEHNAISNLTPLANWNTSKVISTSWMFFYNAISDLTPLANWDVSKVTDMDRMFGSNSITDLSPLTNWKTSNVTSMGDMFANNSISNLTGLANWNVSNVTDMDRMFGSNSITDLSPLTNWKTGKVTDMSGMFVGNKISNLTSLANWDTSKVTDMSRMFVGNKISDLTGLANWDVSKVTDMSWMFAYNPDIIDLRPIAYWDISSINNSFTDLFYGDTKLNLTNVNITPLMQDFLKKPNMLRGATFITNNADLVKVVVGKDLPNLTNTAKRTIIFNIPNAIPETIVQIINYKAITTVQVQFDFDSHEIIQTYPVKDSDWQLDTSKQNDDVIIDGVICFKPVKIPHVNGYKAHLVRNKINPAMLMVSFVAIPSENKPSLPNEVAPSKPSATTDNPNKTADDLKQRVVTELNSNDSGWTMPENNSTYTVEVLDDAIIDLSDLVIAEPVHAQTRVKLAVTKHFKLSKKHVAKHLKHRKKAVKSFKKYRL